MIYTINDNNSANCVFGPMAKVSLIGDTPYTVKWFCDDKYIGEMDIHPFSWGAYPNEFGNWRIEFWNGHEMVGVFNNDLKNSEVLLIATFDNKLGKVPDIVKLENKVSTLRQKYGCEIITYFDKSELFDFPYPVLRMNSNHDFKLYHVEHF